VGAERFGGTFSENFSSLGANDSIAPSPGPKPLPEDPSILLRSVQMQVLDTPEVRERAQQLLGAHHYLGGVQAVGEQVHYAVSDAQGEVGRGADFRGRRAAPASAGPMDRLERRAAPAPPRGQREGRAPETVALITSRPQAELPPAQWLEASLQHWGIETGLHARLDASRESDENAAFSPRIFC